MRINGYFENIKDANTAVEGIREKGFHAWLDLNDDIQNLTNTVHTNGLVTSPTLSSLVMKSDGFSRDDDISPLAAASPMASGMGGFEEIADINAKISAEGEREEIERIILEMGGTLEGPGVDLKQSIEE